MGWTPYVTHRQFYAWLCWLNDQYEVPSRTDFYLMKVCAEVGKAPFRVHGQEPNISSEDYRLRFKEPEKSATFSPSKSPQVSSNSKQPSTETSQPSEDELRRLATIRSKARWGPILGVPKEARVVGPQVDKREDK